jgi:DNA-binding NarL/FixJ family response regulator
MEPIRVLVAEENPLLRAGVCALLEEMPRLRVVGDASDGPEALRLVEGRRPDVALLDVALPVLSGLELAARMKRDFPLTATIIFSAHRDGAHLREALRSGAAGYVLKDCPVGEVRLAIEAAARGEAFLSPAVSGHLISDYVGSSSGHDSRRLLTPRQVEVLKLIARGQSTKGIARLLGISVKTVETHRALLMERLGIRDVAGLVRFAIRDGLASADA